jgi:steroid 5-alpha reductase family enzyme
VSVLYVAQTSPVFYRLYNGATDVVLPYIGLVLSIAALAIESLADKQKSDQKTINPNMVATEGLYKMVRCPNYFGEILFWTGMFVGGLSALNHWGQWLVASIGYVAIVLIMFNGASRLEKRQNGRYGAMPEYQTYVSKTPIILPLIPLYRLNKDGGSSKNDAYDGAGGLYTGSAVCRRRNPADAGSVQ